MAAEVVLSAVLSAWAANNKRAKDATAKTLGWITVMSPEPGRDALRLFAWKQSWRGRKLPPTLAPGGTSRPPAGKPESRRRKNYESVDESGPKLSYIAAGEDDRLFIFA